MSYPQEIASAEVIEGNYFYRLNTLLQTGGDLYEIDESVTSFVIGPQSDIARARITYYDPSKPGKSASFVVSVDDPFIGTIKALTSQPYPVAGTPARLIVSLEDLFVPFSPTALAGDIVAFVRPRLDLLAYLQPPNVVPEKRADFLSNGRVTIIDSGGGNGNTYLLIPWYRRKYSSIQFANYTGTARSVSVDGISFTTDAAGIPLVPKIFDRSIIAGGAITAAAAGVNSTSAFTVKASASGLFDYLQIKIYGSALDGTSGPNGLYYRITNTDEEV